MLKKNNFFKLFNRRYSSVEGLVITKKNDKAIIQFDRPNKLNAFTIEIQANLGENLCNLNNDPNVSAVILKGNEAGFSAGGDVVQFSELLQTVESKNYFFNGAIKFYRGLLCLSEFKKPVISLANGICMGGGAAVAMFSNHCVTTETTVFAMPEVFIGLYPNVGANYFVARLPRNIGMWMALTGQRFYGSDIVKMGMSKNYVKSDDIKKLEEALIELETTNNETVSQTINKFSTKPDLSGGNFDLNQIEKIFSGNSVEEIIENLKKDESEFSKKIQKLFSTLSPTALKLTFNLFRESQLRKYDANSCLSADLSLFVNFYGESKANANDFHEGIRSVLIDRTHKPNWIPKQLNEVDDRKLISYFIENVTDIRTANPLK